jgi:ferredoxin
MAKITHNYENCIGCGSCEAVCPQFWKMDYEKGKADLVGAKKDPVTGDEELEALEENMGCNQEAADVCPVQVIKITK